MKQGISRLVHQCGVTSVNYCVISNRHGEAFQHVKFERRFDKECSLVKEILALERETKHVTLDDYVHEAGNVFEGQTARKKVCCYKNGPVLYVILKF